MEFADLLSTYSEVFGRQIVDLIIDLAGLLTKSESSPGIVATALVAVLVGLSFLYWFKALRQRRAISQMQNLLREYSGIPEFAENYEIFRSKVEERKNSSAAWSELWQAWDEFSETIVPDDIDGRTVLRNSIRPGSFLNVEDLAFGPGFYRIWPNVFVSIGLLLTFLGLVAALHDFSQSMTDKGMDSAMLNFMQIASAKFVMSLVGLACSILFNMLLRGTQDRVDRSLHQLCLMIERRLVFVSLEDLGFRQLKAATEQREHLREIGFAMVAELRKPLDALPEQITRSISEEMGPIFERVGNMGTSNMEGLVGDLSSQLTHSVGNALNRASESLGEASDRIGTMVDRMNASNTQAGDGLQSALGEMATAVQDLRNHVSETGQTASAAMTEGADKLLGVMNETLSGIRDNTSEGAQAMSAAAQEMRKAAEGFRAELSAAAEDGAAAARLRMEASSAEASETIDDAGKRVLEAFESSSQKIAELGVNMGNVVGDEIMGRIEAVNSQLAGLALAIEQSAAGTRDAASGLSRSATAITEGSTSFNSASQSLVKAAEPLRASHERIEGELRKVSSTVETVSETLLQASRQIAENARHVLETAQTGLGTEREGVRQSLEATRAALSQLSDEAEKLDEIDEMLGRALKDYSTQLEAALGSAQDHITEMRDTLAPGIDTLRSVVEQAESFMPAQSRRP